MANDEQPLVHVATAPLAVAGAAASAAAARGSFAAYRDELAAQSRRAQRADLAAWSAYLTSAKVANAVCAWEEDPACWRGVTWGLVAGFVRWQLNAGYAVATVGRRLATVKRYVELAAQAGAVAADELQLVRAVRAPSGKRARNLDAQRETTRRGRKKAQPTTITRTQARQLKHEQPVTPQGRRDTLLLCLLLDHGLRVSEVADLPATAINVQRGTMTFYRRKVDITQTHRLSTDSLAAAKAYLAHDAPAAGKLLRGSRQGGMLTGGMSIQSVRERVKTLGVRVGIVGLSPHDLRHYWATLASRSGTPIRALQDAGGWASPAMPLRYAQAAEIANDGVRLDASEESETDAQEGA